MKSDHSPLENMVVSGHARRLRAAGISVEGDFFGFGNGLLELRSGDPDFRARFRYLFAECAVPQPAASAPVSRCVLTTDESLCLATMSHARPLDMFAFTLQSGSDLGLIDAGRREGSEWRYLTRKADPSRPVAAVRRDQIIFDRTASWQGVLAQVAISDTLRQQDDVLFFHAATLTSESRGIFLSGDKGSGKTTLALALASRGCGFLGDEYGAIESRTKRILPMRRAVSIRPGPRPSRLDAVLDGKTLVTDRTPDGMERIRVSVLELFPECPAHPARLTHAFFLRGFASEPRLIPFLPGEGEVPLLRPLLATVWEQPPGKRVIEFLRLLDGVRCFHLEAGGTPDQTADLMLRALEAA